MTEEVRRFSEFMKNVNDTEKTTLRLEVEQVAPRGRRMAADPRAHPRSCFCAAHRCRPHRRPAVHRTHHELSERLRDTVRRLGLTPYVAEPDEPFDAERHQLAGNPENIPTARSSAKPSAPATRFRENSCAPPSCACAKRKPRPQYRCRLNVRTMSFRFDRSAGFSPLQHSKTSNA